MIDYKVDYRSSDDMLEPTYIVHDPYGYPTRHQPWLLLLLGHPANTDTKSPQRRQDVVSWVE